MSNQKNDNQTLAKLEMEAAPLPFFAHLLSNQGDTNVAGGPTDYCWDNPCQTKKYPSDGDEPTSRTYDL
jgi:hypothetical protein